jgi:hypothetical protein
VEKIARGTKECRAMFRTSRRFRMITFAAAILGGVLVAVAGPVANGIRWTA